MTLRYTEVFNAGLFPPEPWAPLPQLSGLSPTDAREQLSKVLAHVGLTSVEMQERRLWFGLRVGQ